MIRLVRKYATIVSGIIMCIYMTSLQLSTTSVNSFVYKMRGAPLENASMQLDAISIFDDVDFTNVPAENLTTMVKNSLLKGYFDQKARYRMIANAFVAEKYYKLAKEPACVALQSTFDVAPTIKRYIKNWPGSISFALFVPSHFFYFSVIYIKHLRKCHPAIRDQVSWHLSYPKRLPPPTFLADLLRLEFNCSTPDEQIPLLLHAAADANETMKRLMPTDLLYPQNTMRNLARLHCKSQWVMCPDADMVFPDDTHPAHSNSSMYSRLKTFLRSSVATECYKCAFVFPLYEVEDLGQQVLPRSKSELLSYIARNKSQVYHVQTFLKNQQNSNLSAWEQLPLRQDVAVAAKINFTWWYEPVYIVQQGSPNFDERYIGYGMTRNTQALEMHLADYTFHLLDTIFLCHLWGLKLKDSDSSWRTQQSNINKKIFFTFHVRELAIRYDTDLTYLLKVNSKMKFRWHFNIGVHVNPVNESVQQLLAILGAVLDRAPGTYGF